MKNNHLYSKKNKKNYRYNLYLKEISKARHSCVIGVLSIHHFQNLAFVSTKYINKYKSDAWHLKNMEGMKQHFSYSPGPLLQWCIGKGRKSGSIEMAYQRQTLARCISCFAFVVILKLLFVSQYFLWGFFPLKNRSVFLFSGVYLIFGPALLLKVLKNNEMFLKLQSVLILSSIFWVSLECSSKLNTMLVLFCLFPAFTDYFYGPIGNQNCLFPHFVALASSLLMTVTFTID